MSHFPDISELDSPALSNNTSNGASAANFDVDDPTADFLARERAALGGDVDLLSPQPPASTLSSASGQGYSAFGESVVAMEMDVATSTRDPDTDHFERNFPALDNTTAATTTITTFHSTSSVTSGAFSPNIGGQEESTFVREWRERQAAVITDREARATDEKAKRIEQARKAIDRFYEDYNTKREKSIATNRANQEEDSYGTDGANIWERACRMADLVGSNEQKKKAQPKTNRDSTRLRNLLLDLRKDPKAPGVAAQ
ncbi:clathrin light chain [Syncephalis plumigaleata]|nr:clathrin light chain [Syncephalis plumigaleata]